MIDELKPYPEYKDSNIGWLASVPSHWSILPGKACFSEIYRSNKGMVESTVLSLSFGRIVVKPKEKLHGLVPESFETYQVIEPGDIIIRPTDLQNDWNSLRTSISPHRGIITSAYIALHPRGLMESEFCDRMLRTYDLLKVFYGLGCGLRQNLSWADFKYLPCVLPPPDEQAAIVKFLDYANRKIERAIRAKRKLIGLLNEQKQAIIHRAVTRGLDPNVKLKPSGIPWLGDVPEHWEVRRAKYIFKEVDERSTTGEEELLSVSHITGVTPRSEKNITMFKAASYMGSKICRIDDLVINTMWAWMAALGSSTHHGIVSPAYGVYRPLCHRVIYGRYIEALLHTPHYMAEILFQSTGIRASRLRLYPEKFLEMPLIAPPYDEQIAMFEWTDGETKHLTSAIVRAEREIDLLREYRTTLSAEVVTGKLDVREAAKRLPDEAVEILPPDDSMDGLIEDEIDEDVDA
jgi:type I restriction enzyme S subunit